MFIQFLPFKFINYIIKQQDFNHVIIKLSYINLLTLLTDSLIVVIILYYINLFFWLKLMSETNINIEQNLESLFHNWSGSHSDHINQLPHSGSGRIYYRLQKDNISAIGAFNENSSENIAFINFTEQFLNHRINVPEIHIKDLSNNVYLISDLGDIVLLEWLKSKNSFDNEALVIYKKVIQELIRMQVIAGKNFNYSKCYPYKNFDKESILFDLNYFKSKFVDGLNLNYDNTKLNKDFDKFSNYLLSTNTSFFMFRDFQARNIMLKKNEPYFIDYQGGRQGALQYDLASLLFQAKAQIPENIKIKLLEYYIQVIKLLIPLNQDEFIEYYYAYALIRVLQTFGAYGLRGIIENKKHFIESIPFAVNNLIYLQNKVEIIKKLPELNKLIALIINTEIDINEK